MTKNNIFKNILEKHSENYTTQQLAVKSGSVFFKTLISRSVSIFGWSKTWDFTWGWLNEYNLGFLHRNISSTIESFGIMTKLHVSTWDFYIFLPSIFGISHDFSIETQKISPDFLHFQRPKHHPPANAWRGTRSCRPAPVVHSHWVWASSTCPLKYRKLHWVYLGLMSFNEF